MNVGYLISHLNLFVFIEQGIFSKCRGLVQAGLSDKVRDWDSQLPPYFCHRRLLTTLGPVIIVNDCPVVPLSLRARVVDQMHEGHPGLAALCQRMALSLYWPDYRISQGQDVVHNLPQHGTLQPCLATVPALGNYVSFPVWSAIFSLCQVNLMLPLKNAIRTG